MSLSDSEPDRARIVVHNNVDGTVRVELVVGVVVEDSRTGLASQKAQLVKELADYAKNDRGLNVELVTEHNFVKNAVPFQRGRVERL